MSISGISSSSNAYQNQLQQIAQAFSNLQTDVSTGSLSTAQQAYATLMQDVQNAQQAQGAQQTGGSEPSAPTLRRLAVPFKRAAYRMLRAPLLR